MDHIAVFLDEGRFLRRKGAITQCGDVLIELRQVERGRHADIDIGVGKDEPVAHSWRGYRLVPGPQFLTPDKVSPAGGSIAYKAGIMIRQMRKNILLGAAVCGIIAHHGDIDRPLIKQAAGEFAVMTGNANRANFPLISQTAELLA